MIFKIHKLIKINFIYFEFKPNFIFKKYFQDYESCNEYLEKEHHTPFQSDIIQHNKLDPNNSENYSSLIYLYNLSFYYWELLKSYRNHIQYVQRMLNFREHLEEHLPNSSKEPAASVKTNLAMENNYNALKTLETTKKVDKLCPNPACQNVNSPRSPNCDTLKKDENVKDAIDRLRLVGLSFLDMGHLLLQDDPHYPIIPKHNVKNVEYIYPRADES